MDFFDAVEKRFSCRKFQNKPVEMQAIQKMKETIINAPSAGNLQSYSVIIVKELNARKALASACLGQDFISEAPVVFVFLLDEEKAAGYGKRGKELYSVQDAAIACTHGMLAATSLNLASCWVGAFNEEEVRKVLKTSLKPVSVLPVGYGAQVSGKKSRRKELFREI